MGELIAFRLPRRSVDARPSRSGAQILFFTGVRYERMTEYTPASLVAPDKPQERGNRGVGRGKRRRRG